MSWFKRLFSPPPIGPTRLAESVTAVGDTHVALDADDNRAEQMLELSKMLKDQHTSLIELRMQVAAEQGRALALEVKIEAACRLVAHLAAAHAKRHPQLPLTMDDVKRIAAQAVMTQRLMAQDQTMPATQALREASLEVRAKARSQRLGEIFEVEQAPPAPLPERL